MRFFLDTEFIEDGVRIWPLSIALAGADGSEFYYEVADIFSPEPNDFVKEHVLPHMGKKPDPLPMTKMFHYRWTVPDVPPCSAPEAAVALKAFVGPGKPEFWAHCGAYDWVLVCQLFGTMMDLPENWPHACFEINQLRASLGNPILPEHNEAYGPKHHALADARHERDVFNYLARIKKGSS
jgi:hypothetical protein